jgi:hypothetical protein
MPSYNINYMYLLCQRSLAETENTNVIHRKNNKLMFEVTVIRGGYTQKSPMALVGATTLDNALR